MAHARGLSRSGPEGLWGWAKLPGIGGSCTRAQQKPPARRLSQDQTRENAVTIIWRIVSRAIRSASFFSVMVRRIIHIVRFPCRPQWPAGVAGYCHHACLFATLGSDPGRRDRPPAWTDGGLLPSSSHPTKADCSRHRAGPSGPGQSSSAIWGIFVLDLQTTNSSTY